jgi:hypothetical protein
LYIIIKGGSAAVTRLNAAIGMVSVMITLWGLGMGMGMGMGLGNVLRMTLCRATVRWFVEGDDGRREGLWDSEGPFGGSPWGRTFWWERRGEVGGEVF